MVRFSCFETLQWILNGRLAKVDEQGIVIEVAEKKPISDLATVGIYLFTRGRDFVSAAVDMLAANDRVNGEFYTCPVYNYMITNGARIGVYEGGQWAPCLVSAHTKRFDRFSQLTRVRPCPKTSQSDQYACCRPTRWS